MKKLKIFLVLLCGTLIASCESNTIQEVSGIVTNPTYAKNISPVIQAQCVGCHSAAGQYPSLETFAEVKDAAETGSLICRIDQSQSCGRVMPQSGAMPQATIDMIKLWQTQGYPN
jgi:uncharacterized membrane protein